MTRLELANQLIENQSAFHFAFIPMVRVERFELITKLILSQPPLPIGLRRQKHFRFVISDCRFNPPGEEFFRYGRPIGNQQSGIGNALVDLARFERATSTFAESRSDSAELQVHVRTVCGSGRLVFE